MLQIISGKFFESDDRFSHDGKGILFSNYSWVQAIETCVATLEPVDTYASVSSYVVSYCNQIEKEKPPAKNVLVRTGDSEIVEQFMIICSFFLEAFFHQDRSVVATACRDQKYSSSDYCIPSQFVPRVFSRQIRGNTKEIDDFTNFVDEVICLKREDYTSVITSLRCFNDAMQIVGVNIDLAYSLLIYSIEALAQRSDSFKPTWEDYPQNTQYGLNDIFIELDTDVAGRIKDALLKDSNLKSTVRFLNFVRGNIEDSFFIQESPEGYMALRRSEFDRALKNAYVIRSKFAHLLQPIQEQLRHPQMADGDIVRFADEPYLTIAGLARIARHVIRNFINKANKVVHEGYDWRASLPGIMRMEMAPQYWIWQHEGVKAEHATKKLSGFLSQLEAVKLRSEAITDLRDLLEKYEKLICQSSSPYRVQLLTTYVLYNGYVNEEHRNKNYSKVFEKNKKIFDECTIETMLAWLLMGQNWPWQKEECSACWNSYLKAIHRKNSIKIPPVMNVAILLEIASMFLNDENESEYRKWMDIAILETAGQKVLQQRLIQVKSDVSAIKGMELFNASKVNQDV